MNRALIDDWNETVAENDTVWVIGEFALGKIAETLPIAADLHGSQDPPHGQPRPLLAGHGRRAEGWTERYLEAGFDEVVHGAAKLEVGDRTVLACHFPYRGDSHDHDRFVEHRPIDKGAWLLHGHVHERWTQQGRMINVGVDATGFRPISQSAIAALIDAGPTRSLSHRNAHGGTSAIRRSERRA